MSKYKIKVDMVIEVNAESEAEAIGKIERLRNADSYTTAIFNVNPCRSVEEITEQGSTSPILTKTITNEGKQTDKSSPSNYSKER